MQRVQGGRQSLTHSCATQNHADKPWYAWWQFQPEANPSEIIKLPPNAQQSSGAFQVSVSYALVKCQRYMYTQFLAYFLLAQEKQDGVTVVATP